MIVTVSVLRRQMGPRFTDQSALTVRTRWRWSEAVVVATGGPLIREPWVERVTVVEPVVDQQDRHVRFLVGDRQW